MFDSAAAGLVAPCTLLNWQLTAHQTGLMCGPSIGADAPADVDLAAAMATARKRGIRAAAFRATDATTLGAVAQGIWVWDETSPIYRGREVRKICVSF